MKYQLNPIIVDAVQWDGSVSALDLILNLAQPNPNQIRHSNDLQNLMIVNTSGTTVVRTGDCIVKGVTHNLFVIPKEVVQILLKKVE